MSQPGYPLPDGELGADEIVCQLVYLPDRPEYWQALFGALHYMTTWRAWERDDDKRGKDAASNWREAFEFTVGCWRMTCLEQLQSDVSDILALLQTNDLCCGDNITYGDQTTYITIIVPGDGDAPDYYGETAVSDWDEWLEYLCHNANLWVDELVSQANSFETVLSVSAMTVALFAFAIEAIAFFVVGGQVHGPDAISRVINMIAGYVANLWGDAADDIEAARFGITCAIISGRDVGAAIEAAIDSDAWDLFYQFIDYESAMAILYEGGDGEDNYLEAELDGSCTCDCAHAFTWDSEYNTIVYSSAAGCQIIMERALQFGNPDAAMGTFVFNFEAGEGFCGPMKVIDSATIVDGLDLREIITYDQDNNIIDNFYDGGNDCDEPISQIVGTTIAKLYMIRLAPAMGGCGSADLTINITWHDA